MRKGGKLEGWKVEKLGDVCDIVNGSTPLRSNKSFWENGNISWFTIDDIRTQGRTITETKQKVTQTALEESSLRMLPINSVLLCCTASIGEYAITEIPLATNQQFNGLVVKNQKLLSPYFLFHYCATLKDKLLNLSGKTTIDFIPISRLREIEIPTPPLPEQQRIVSVLDEAFSSIAQAKSNAERNLVNARELFDSYVENIFAKSSEEWEEKKLGDKSIIEIIDNDRGVNYPKKSDFHPEGYCLFMNTKNVRPDGFDFTTTMFITEKKDKALGKGKLSRNDVVMTTRGTIGNLGVYNDEVPFEQIRTNSGMLIFRPNLKYIVPEYLFEILRSGIIKSQITKHVSGAAQPQLPIKTLVNFTFPLPKSLAEQRAIVGRLEALSAETGRLEEIYQQKVESLEELKKSVLGKAFAGEM